MDRTKPLQRAIQALTVVVAAISTKDLLALLHESLLAGAVCVVTAVLLVIHTLTANSKSLGRSFLLLHVLAGANMVVALGTLWSKASAEIHVFHVHSLTYPLAAYLLYFAKFTITKYPREKVLFGLGLSAMASASAFSGVTVLFQLFALPSEFLNVKIEAMPLSSALLVFLSSGYTFLSRYLSQQGSARQTLLILVGVAFIASTGALSVRKFLLENLLEVESARARTFAEVSAKKIENELINLAEAVERMADRVATGAYPDISSWQLDANNYVFGFESLSGLGWMDENFRFIQAAPAEILPVIQNVDLDFNPVRKEALLQAAKTKEVLISAPFRFQGPKAQVSLMAPIVKDGQTTGIIGSALNLEGLFSEVSKEFGETFDYSVTDGDQLVFASGEIDRAFTSSFIFAMNRRWVLTVPFDGAGLCDVYVWGQRFAVSRLLALVVIVFAVERARFAWRSNRKLNARNAELIEAQLVLQAQDEEISLMRTSLAHDLKSPIRNVRTVTKMWDQLKETKGLTDQDLRERILDNLTRLENLSLSFTDFLAARVVKPAKQPEYLLEILGDLRDRFAERCQIAVDVKDESKINTDWMLLGRILDNLVENSINAATKGSVCVSISVQDLGLTYRITYRDNGRGIPEGLRERIFNPFDNGDSQRRNSSSGMGLTIIRRLLSNLGGTIACVDPGPAGGAVFMIELPKE